MMYQMTLSLISPLHIGSGGVLLRDFDFKTSRGQTWVLDQDAILADEYDRGTTPQPDWQRLNLPPGQLVQEDELHDGSPFVRYALAGSTTVDQVREQIKDVYGQCYLPGSSIKGALRTLLMSHAVRSGSFKPDLQQLGNRREWAGQTWERAVFGPNPNHDLLRALAVSDSQPLPTSPSPLVLLDAQVFTGGAPGSPIVVEALKPDTVIQTTLRLDDYLLGSEVSRQLGFDDGGEWLKDLAQIANHVSHARVEQELAWYRSKPDFQAALSVYSTFERARLGENAFLLQLGWGGGWTAKSVAAWLPKSEQDQLRRKYQLGRPPRAPRDWQPDLTRPFPTSRRLRARRSTTGQVVSDVPLGWVLVEMEQVQQ